MKFRLAGLLIALLVSTGLRHTVWAEGPANLARAQIDVMDFGAVPENPTVDNTPMFQRALNAGGLRGSAIVWVPSLRFTLRGNLTIPAGVVLAGNGRGPYDPVISSPALKRQGPTLLPEATFGPAFIRIVGANSGVQDLIITYPKQFAPSATAPRVYPPTIQAEQPAKITRMLLTNSYDGVRVLVGRVYIEESHIGAYHRGVVVDNALDEVRIARTVFEPFWNWGLPFGQPVDYWVLANGVGITAGKADGFRMTDVLIFGQNTGILFAKSAYPQWPDGAVSGSGSDVNLDTVMNGVVAQATEERVGFTFTNLHLGPFRHEVTPGYVPGHAIWLQRLSPSTTSPPIISVVGGSIRHLWATQPGGEDWAFRVDVGELYRSRIVGDDLSIRR